MLLLPVFFACATDDVLASVEWPDVYAATFVDGVDNPYLPCPVGATWHYTVATPIGAEAVDVAVTGETKEIEGVVATALRETVTRDGDIVQDTTRWYAQDTDGNVWYLGEATCAYQDGQCIDTAGSWAWGADGALPGWAMPGDPQVDGQRYRQQYDRGRVEDVAEVVATDATSGDFSDCIETHETSTLAHQASERDVYCRDIGLVYAEGATTVQTLDTWSFPAAPVVTY